MKTLGFTLLETIIYCALFSLLMTGGLVTTYALMSSSAGITQKTNTIAESIFINQKFAWAISGAEEIIKVDDKTIYIIRPDLGKNSPLIFNFYDEQLYLSRNTSTPQVISGNSFKIKNEMIDIRNTEIKITYTINKIPFIFFTTF
ncbi:hypothetical protein K2P47_00595 [Patescibacteria group bacterium]|nr:hypothetical protein [Patescibacteria group bacterium]